MIQINNPPGGRPKDPYEEIRAQRIERERMEKEEAKKRAQWKKSKLPYFIWIQLLLFFKKTINLFINPKEAEEQESAEKMMVSDLTKFNNALERLKTIDFSQDLPYLNFFSDIWHSFLDDAARVKKDVVFYPELEGFIEAILAYPHGQEHSLGYYLSEFAGSDWLPFPFMELLAKLHIEHTAHPETSHLKQWTELLKVLIAEINTHG